jgi:putative AdoMet-dependent methyltransferase
LGLEFLDVFEHWAVSYDESVSGHNREYKAVLTGYEQILEAVTALSKGNVLEFGVGTGNLTKKIDRFGFEGNWYRAFCTNEGNSRSKARNKSKNTRW